MMQNFTLKSGIKTKEANSLKTLAKNKINSTSTSNNIIKAALR